MWCNTATYIGCNSLFVVGQGKSVGGVWATCTHQACALAWRRTEGVLICPCHGARFGTDGRSLTAGYRLPPLPRVQVRIAEGRVEVLGT